MKKVKIAQIAPLWIPVPPRTYGGIELMLSNLTEELVRRGHEVTLFASGDSRTKANLVSPIEKGLWLMKGLRSPHAAIAIAMKKISEKMRAFDIIHDHFGFFMFPVSLFHETLPFLVTIHRPIDELYARALREYPNISCCTLSEDAKQSAEEQGIEVEGVVPNGIQIENYEFNETPEDYLLYLGRLNREKGIMPAINVARAARKKLVIAGNLVGAEEWNYFMHEIQPLLNNQEDIKFVGQVNFEEKVRLLQGAEALLFPIDRREPFGLVMIEAMACGTPVIAFDKGSVREVVEHGKTGFVVNTEEEMIDALAKIRHIDRNACRKRVEKHFGLDLMIDRYEALYEKILGKK